MFLARSDLLPSTVELGILARSTLPVADGLVLGDQLDGAQLLYHFVAQLGPHAQAKWRSMRERQWLIVEVVRQDCL
jgi:hypothetical protein